MNNQTGKGIYFDLIPIFNQLNKKYFNNQIKASLRWGSKRSSSKPKKSIRLGSYQPSHKIITIHPSLDQAMVPIICIERILFHEMAHQRFPAKKDLRGRILVHYHEFFEFEKRYEHLSQADNWLKHNLSQLCKPNI